jgi:hypothetical protein
MHLTTTNLCRAALAVSLLPFTMAASCDGGDREHLGRCPDGETCSPATPDGLHFRGALLGENLFDSGFVKTTAVGGTQEVHVQISDENGELVPFVMPYHATIDDPSLAIDTSAADAFTLRGKAAGEAYVRLVDATGALFDRLRVVALPIASVAPEMSFAVSVDSHGIESLLYAPGSTALLGLRDANQHMLVDTSAQITGTGVTQTGWDRFVVGDLPLGVHTVSVAAGHGAPITVPFEVVQPDHIAMTWTSGTVTKDEPNFVCFVARRGQRPVHTAFEYASNDATIELTQFAGCVDATPHVLGPVIVNVRAAGLSADIEFTSVATRVAPPILPPSIGETAGERAAL